MVSVLIDVSDGELYLDQALSSIAVQTFTNFEIVLCSHGATSGTDAIIADWEARESRLQVIRCPHLPLARAHDCVARAARGKLLARLDADDIARPDRLEHQVRMFMDNPTLGFAGSAVDVIDETGAQISHIRNPLGHSEIAAAMDSACPIVHSSLMVRAPLFWQAGGYREGLNISEDYDLYSRLIEHGRAANNATALVAYRVHSGGMTNRQTQRMAIANEAIRAAASARRRGLPEPFVGGIPSLRRCGTVFGISRAKVRRGVLARVWQTRTSRLLLTGWAPLRINGWLRNLALRLGFRPLYSALFRSRAWLAERAGLLRAR
jgi:glycosyltransferase involved in cell wall biosynthesis